MYRGRGVQRIAPHRAASGNSIKRQFDEDEGRPLERACTDKREVGLWTDGKRRRALNPELFPEDFGERLERLIELAGLSREEFAERLGIEYDRVVEWFEGAELTGGEVWHVARLAWSVPGGLEIIVPEAKEGTE